MRKKALGLDLPSEEARIVKFLKERLKTSGAKGIVIGISGGIDSAVTCVLAIRALGFKKVTGLLMFEDGFENSADYMDARELTLKFGLKTIEIGITPIIKAFSQGLGLTGLKISKIGLANIKARIRMTLLYAVANQRRLIVAGTGDRSEELVGYFTKYGDGGVDIMPIAHLYKTEIRQLAKGLDIPSRIIEKPSTPNLWENHKASDELPADYPILDNILKLLFDQQRVEAEITRVTGISPSTVRKVLNLHNRSKHKREYPPMIDR
ncbi:MAG TPA: NAD+ synthase [Nitrososphaerales archaeon]|nr:NAD+ synthase [Nitrososphaerales archaeon]